MADKGGGSIIQIIHETAYALAKKEMNLKEDDKQDQTKLTILQMKLNQNEEEVIQKVNSILKQIEVSFSGAVIPKGIDMEAATHVLNQVTMNGLTSPSEISIGEDVAKECLISALQSSDREFEDIDKKEFQKSNYIYEEIISEAIKENTTTVEENRPKVIVENPDGRYSIETIQAEQDIEDYKEKAKLFIKNGDMKGLDKFIKSISEGQGNDGTIRAIVELIKEDGGKSTKDIQNLFNSLNLVVKNRDVYEQDISTFTYHIELLVHINRVINSCDNVEQKRLYSQMLENITKIDPKAAKYYQEHPELKNLKSTNELHDAVGEVWNDDEKGKNKDVDSFCKKLDEKIQELSKMNTSRDDTSGKKLNESTISSNTPQYRESVEIIEDYKEKAKLFIKNGDMKGLDKFIKSISEGQGNDGTIRAIVELIKEDGRKSTKDIQNLFNSLNLVVKNRDIYEQDISTFTYHIELLVHINRVINSCDNIEQKRLYSQMLENTTKIDPKATKYYQEHPELKALKSTDVLHDVVGEFWNDDEKGKNKDVDSFCKKLDEKIQELSKMNTSRDDTSGKKLNESTISSNTPQYRKSVEIMLKDRQKALSTAIKMLSSQATEDKKDVFQDVIIERLLEAKYTPEINSPEALEQKKKLFEIVIARSMSNEKDVDLQLVNNLITIDSRVVKEILKENLIPAQNDAPSHIMGQYVQAIGEGLKASSPKVLDSEKTPLGKIASIPNALVENVKKVDRTHTDEDEGPEI